MKRKFALLLCVSMVLCSAVAYAQSERGSDAWTGEMWAKARDYEKNDQKAEALEAYKALTDYGNNDSTRLESSRARVRIFMADKNYTAAVKVLAEAEVLMKDKNMADQILYAHAIEKVDQQPLMDAISELYANKTGAPMTRLLLAKLYYEQKKDVEARAMIGKVYSEIVKDTESLKMLVQAIQHDDALNAWRLDLTRYMAKLAPDDMFCALAHANAAADAKLAAETSDEARRIMENTTKQTAHEWLLLCGASSACQRVKVWDDAIKASKMAVDCATNSKEATLFELGNIYKDAGRTSEASEIYNQLAEQDKNAVVQKLAKEALAKLKQ